MVSQPNLRDGEPPATGGPSASAFKPKLFKLIRRVHLYSGLFLWPLVFAYTVSGYLFNHPNQLRAGAPSTFGEEVLAKTSFVDGPDAPAIAAEVVAQLRAGPHAAGAGNLELVDPAEARFSGSIEMKARQQEKDYTIRVFPDGRYGQLIATTEKPPPAPPAPFARKEGIESASPLLARWRADAAPLAEQLGLAGAEVRVEKTPHVLFDLAVDGKVWHATYDPMKGSLSGQSAEAPGREISFRSLMVSLHGARGFPDRGGVRWFWGLQVDAVAILMMLWSLTGLTMWWQQKRLRKIGAVVLVAGAVVAFALISGMYAQFTH